jgi:hypothetical protein
MSHRALQLLHAHLFQGTLGGKARTRDHHWLVAKALNETYERHWGGHPRYVPSRI